MPSRCRRKPGSPEWTSTRTKKVNGKTAPRFVFFAGKGGVGKTTCAVEYARAGGRPQSDGRSTLIVSTDPAHSLGDVLGVRLGATPKRVGPGLSAVELDAPRAFRRWMSNNRRALTDILERGTWLDRHDASALLDLTIPGVDELAGLIEISALANGPFERVIVDTAPTGHTLRLLAAPAAVTILAGVLDALEEDHRIIREQFARVVRPDAADRLIELLAGQAADVRSLLSDRLRTSFHWVTLPEALAVAESRDGLAALETARIRVAEVIVNRVWPKGPKCAICDSRRTSERAVIADIRRSIARGRRCRLVHEHLANRANRVDSVNLANLVNPVNPVNPANLVSSARLIFVGGKGGVGKTTVAAAIAMRVARSNPRKSVLLLSTDPAHSLGDVFNTFLGDDERTVPGGPANMVVRELDAVRALAAQRSAFEAALQDADERVGAGAAQASRLMDLAPPGVDELFGMVSILDAQSTYSVIVVDTAPTGHTLRLLELPDAAREWVQAMLRVLLKYKHIVRPGNLGAELVKASQSIRTLQSLLRDADRTRFLVVTRAERTVRAETERLLKRLRALKLATPAIVVNARALEPRCPLCRASARSEEAEMLALWRFVRAVRLRDCAIIQTPVAAPPPRGAAALENWARHWHT